MNYYFIRINGILQMVSQEDEINLGLNHNVTAMSSEQIAFWNNNPTATPYEVFTCKMYSEPISNEVEVDIEKYKKDVKKKISEKSLASLNEKVCPYQLANAMCGVYDEVKSDGVINTYKILGTECRNKYYSACSMIDEAESVSDIDDIMNDAISFYDNL